MPVAAFVTSTFITIFTRSLTAGPALISLLVTAVIVFEPPDTRTAQHLIDVAIALWLGVTTGFLFLVASGLTRLVDLNFLQPTISWPLVSVFVSFVIIAVAGSLTVRSYTDGSASVLDFSLVMVGFLLALLAFALLFFSAKGYRRPPLSTVKYGLVLLLLTATLTVAPLAYGSLPHLAAYIAFIIFAYVASAILFHYSRVPNDPLPRLLSRGFLLVVLLVLHIVAVALTIVNERTRQFALIGFAVIWSVFSGLVMRFVLRTRAPREDRELEVGTAELPDESRASAGVTRKDANTGLKTAPLAY